MAEAAKPARKLTSAERDSARAQLARGDEPEQVAAYFVRLGLPPERARRSAEKLHREYQDGLRDGRRSESSAEAQSSARWVIVAAVCAVLLCTPAGLLAIHLANQAKAAAGRGEPERARASLRNAQIVSILGIVGGVVGLVAYLATRG